MNTKQQQTTKIFKGEILSDTQKIKLDLIDRKILFLLSLNARYSYNAIAKAIKIKREVVAYRLKRMEDEGFLRGYFTLIDTTKLGYQLNVVYLKFFNVMNDQELKEFLHSIHAITRIKECAGNYDMQIIFSTKTIEEFDNVLDKVMSKLAQNIKNYTILRVVDEDFMGLHLLLTSEEKKDLHIKETKGSAFQKEFEHSKKTEELVVLDDKDKKILNCLKLNARMPIKEISEQMNLSPIAVENRLKRLVREKLIKSMYPLFNISMLGYQWYKVFFQVRNINNKEFLEYLKNHENVLWYMKLIGKWNYQFSIFAKDNNEFHKILNDIRTRFSNSIISYDSLIILNQDKFVHRID